MPNLKTVLEKKTEKREEIIGRALGKLNGKERPCKQQDKISKNFKNLITSEFKFIGLHKTYQSAITSPASHYEGGGAKYAKAVAQLEMIDNSTVRTKEVMDIRAKLLRIIAQVEA